jgi:hypothetical protein
MAFERLRHLDLDAGVGGGHLCDQRREIPFQVDSEGQKIGDQYDVPHTLSRQARNCAVKVGLPQFQEGSLHVRKTPGSRKPGGDFPHAFIRRFDTGSVSEDDESGRLSR